MNIPRKTLDNGFSLPIYGLGTWMMGGGLEADYSEDEKYITAIQDALRNGVTHIDTAEMYGNGHAEELIATAMKGIDRSTITLASKAYGGLEGGYDGVVRACHDSLKRLQTNYLDVYMLHRFPTHDLDEVMRAMNRLKSEGLIRNVGVSNFTVERLMTAQKLCETPIVCNQVEYNLQVREAEARGIIKYCQDNDILITAWGPLNKGAMLNSNILEDLAAKYNKTPHQIAINWLVSQENVVTIPKTTSHEHLEENLGAIGWELTDEDIEKLRLEFPGQTTISNRLPLQ